jgi:hypothetical protein
MEFSRTVCSDCPQTSVLLVLSCPSSWDYRSESLHPSSPFFFLIMLESPNHSSTERHSNLVVLFNNTKASIYYFVCLVFWVFVCCLPLCFVFMILGLNTRPLASLARQTLYYLSHTAILFCFSIFSDGISCFFRTVAGLELGSSYLCLLCGWNFSPGLPHPSCLLRWDLTNFLPRLASNLGPPDLHLLSSWDYSCWPL